MRILYLLIVLVLVLIFAPLLTGCGGGGPAVDPANGRQYPYVECVADAVYCKSPPAERVCIGNVCGERPIDCTKKGMCI